MGLITAELVVGNGDFAEELRQTARGWVGRRWFKVNTSNITQAHSAAGLPQRGDAWDDTILPTCTVFEIGTPQRHGGVPGGPGESGGWSFVPVDYAEAIEVLKLPQKPGEKWTEFDVDFTTINVRYGYKPTIEALNPDWKRQIGNGDGVGKEVPVKTALVRKFYDKAAVIDFGRLDSLMGAQPLNKFSISIPGLYNNDPRRFSYGEKQVRYRGYRTKITGGLLEIAHMLVIGDQKVYWWDQDRDGLAQGGIVGVYINDFETWDFAADVA